MGNNGEEEQKLSEPSTSSEPSGLPIAPPPSPIMPPPPRTFIESLNESLVSDVARYFSFFDGNDYDDYPLDLPMGSPTPAHENRGALPPAQGNRGAPPPVLGYRAGEGSSSSGFHFQTAPPSPPSPPVLPGQSQQSQQSQQVDFAKPNSDIEFQDQSYWPDEDEPHQKRRKQ